MACLQSAFLFMQCVWQYLVNVLYHDQVTENCIYKEINLVLKQMRIMNKNTDVASK